ncbi:MAG: AAA family ATPase, partial [Aquificaceae bacterium]|nr:AAA family ATPase [Aquificaceae bacterium]
EDKGYAWMLCPFHEDTNPSLKVNLRKGYFHCVACGETGSVAKLWWKIQGCESLEQARQELVSIGVLKPAKPKEEAVYHYYDKEGWLLFRKRKLRHGDGSKTFVIEHYDHENDLWKTGKPKDCPPVLYDYNRSVIEARYNGGVLYYVEGEKDVETLKALGFLATTAGGAKDWRAELANELAGLDVVIVPDNDPAGKELLVRVGADLLSLARSVCWVDLTEEAKKLGVDFPEKGDITDFLELVKQKGLDPVEVVEGFTLLDFDPQELQSKAKKERLLSSGLFLTKEAIASLSSVEFLFEGFLPWGYMVILSSEPGVGKSRLSWALAREAIKRGVMVVYLDGDNPIPYIVENLQSTGLLDEIGNELFYLSRYQKEICISPTDEAWKTVKAMLKTIGRSFIVVDTLGSMSKGFDPNSDKDMRTVLSELKALRDAGHAVLILHHTQKYASGDERLSAG